MRQRSNVLDPQRYGLAVDKARVRQTVNRLRQGLPRAGVGNDQHGRDVVVMARLTEIGIATKEVRIRKPDLSSLFVAIAGRGGPA